jgi:hypothetical protein
LVNMRNLILVLVVIPVVACGGADVESNTAADTATPLVLNERVFRDAGPGNTAFAGGGCTTLGGSDTGAGKLESPPGSGLPTDEVTWGQTFTADWVHVTVTTPQGALLADRTYTKDFVLSQQMDSFTVQVKGPVYSFSYWGGACSTNFDATGKNSGTP